jgi:hypothetical protein
MDAPPNLMQIGQVLKNPDLSSWTGNLYSTLVCPVCSFDYNHIGKPRRVQGGDAYLAWAGRGDLLVIPFSGECGSEWELCFGFHKGQSSGFVRVSKSCTEDSYLYFIEAVGTDYIKIGRSGNPEKRKQQLATGSPNELALLGAISGGAELERELHQKFDNLRERGEWFRSSGELREFIKQATA